MKGSFIIHLQLFVISTVILSSRKFLHSGDCQDKLTVIHYRCVCSLLDVVKQLSQTDFRISIFNI